jgi:NADH:ubiquinone oxidoreductase subunit H
MCLLVHFNTDIFMFILITVLLVWSVIVYSLNTMSKLAYLGSIRLLYLHISTEILLVVVVLIILIICTRVNFTLFNLFNRNLLVCCSLFICNVYIILIGAGRIPFDLHEAESELVCGYTTELSSLLFVCLIEYFELLLNIHILTVLLCICWS